MTPVRNIFLLACSVAINAVDYEIVYGKSCAAVGLIVTSKSDCKIAARQVFNDDSQNPKEENKATLPYGCHFKASDTDAEYNRKDDDKNFPFGWVDSGWNAICEATPSPTAFPTSVPTGSPTQYPTAFPTPNPTPSPTLQPTLSPTSAPTHQPTKSCPEGTNRIPSSGGVCEQCKAGLFQEATTGETCKLCPAGYFQNATGMTECISWYVVLEVEMPTNKFWSHKYTKKTQTSYTQSTQTNYKTQSIHTKHTKAHEST